MGLKGDAMFIEIARNRRSVRQFKSQEVEKEKVEIIIEAALRAPSGRGTRPWALIVVDDKEMRAKLSVAKPMGADFLKDAPLAVVVCGDTAASHIWVEDCTIVAVTMQYAAHSLGLASRWSHMRANQHSDDISTRKYLQGLLDLPEQFDVQCIIAIGYPDEEIAPYTQEELVYDRISYGRFGQSS